MRYFGPLILVFGLALLIGLLRASDEAIERARADAAAAVDIAPVDTAVPWRAEMSVACVAIALGANVCLVAVMRECRRPKGK